MKKAHKNEFNTSLSSLNAVRIRKRRIRLEGNVAHMEMQVTFIYKNSQNEISRETELYHSTKSIL